MKNIDENRVKVIQTKFDPYFDYKNHKEAQYKFFDYEGSHAS